MKKSPCLALIPPSDNASRWSSAGCSWENASAPCSSWAGDTAALGQGPAKPFLSCPVGRSWGQGRRRCPWNASLGCVWGVCVCFHTYAFPYIPGLERCSWMSGHWENTMVDLWILALRFKKRTFSPRNREYCIYISSGVQIRNCW